MIIQQMLHATYTIDYQIFTIYLITNTLKSLFEIKIKKVSEFQMYHQLVLIPGFSSRGYNFDKAQQSWYIFSDQTKVSTLIFT